jgi:thiamine kinase-like enzyme
VPKLLDFSLKREFPFLIYEFLPGKSKTREDKLSLEEIKKAISLMVLINSTEYDFNFIPKKPLFNFKRYSKTILSLLERLKIENKIEKKILKFVEKTKEIFKFIKPKLNHGDFSEANLVFYKGRVKIIDWEHVHFRNPLYDFVSFWTKRKRERKQIEKEFFKQQKNIDSFFPLFKMALIEISLKNLVFFNEVLKFLEKESETKETLKAKEGRKREIKETLELLRKYL